MGSQMSLPLETQRDFLDGHDLVLRVADHRFDPDDFRCITFMRRYLNESPSDARYVWVTSPHTGGQVRMYILGDGVLRHTYPDYTGAWPELDDAVAARLSASLYGDVSWGHSGPREDWRAHG